MGKGEQERLKEIFSVSLNIVMMIAFVLLVLFELCRIKGFGFLTVNAIAKKVKVSPKNPLRYAGAIEYTLEEARPPEYEALFSSVLHR